MRSALVGQLCPDAQAICASCGTVQPGVVDRRAYAGVLLEHNVTSAFVVML